MSDELFPEVHPPEKKKHDVAIRVAICAMIAVLLGLVCVFLLYVRSELSFRSYFSDFSDSAVYAYENASLRIEVDGKTARLNGQIAYQLCEILTFARGKVRTSVPEDAPGLTFTFGNGAILEIWEVEPDFKTERSTAVQWRFQNAEGKCWIYISDRFTYASIFDQTAGIAQAKLGIAG